MEIREFDDVLEYIKYKVEKYKKKIYVVAFTKENEFNSGDKLLLQEQRALPITKLWEL